MNRSSTYRFARHVAVGGVLAAGLFVFLGTLANANPPLPPLPDPNAPPPPPTTTGTHVLPHTDGGAAPLTERVRRGIVTIERDGRTTGVGTVLSGDGRILTSLSAVGSTDQTDVRYADGTTVRARVGHRDKAWDLALLIPLTGRWTEGLGPSGSDPSRGELNAFIARANRPALVPVAFKGHVGVRSRESEALDGALDLDMHSAPQTLGAPILDGTGNAVGVLVQACKAVDAADAGAAVDPLHPPQPHPCIAVTIGAPVGALRHFLVTTPLSAAIPTPWLGIRGESEQAGNVRGVRVVAVATGSPADKGGLKANLERNLSDLIVAVDTHPVDTPEKLSEVISKHAVGDSVKLLVYSGDHFREVVVVLRAAQP